MIRFGAGSSRVHFVPPPDRAVVGGSKDRAGQVRDTTSRKEETSKHITRTCDECMHEQIVRVVVRTYLPSNDTAVCLIGDLHSWLHSLKMHKCLHPAEASELLASHAGTDARRRRTGNLPVN